VFVAGWDEGVQTLKDCCAKIELNATTYVHIPERDIPFAFTKPITGMNAEQSASFRARCLIVGRSMLESKGKSEELAAERALGYGNRAMLLVSTYNVPTQVLTCLWEEGDYDGVKWLPLLRRRKKS
jgi:hypothetical protein